MLANDERAPVIYAGSGLKSDDLSMCGPNGGLKLTILALDRSQHRLYRDEAIPNVAILVLQFHWDCRLYDIMCW